MANTTSLGGITPRLGSITSSSSSTTTNMINGDHWVDMGDRVVHYDALGTVLEVLYKNGGGGGLQIMQPGSPLVGGYSAFPAIYPAPEPTDSGEQFEQSLVAEEGTKYVKVVDTVGSDYISLSVGRTVVNRVKLTEEEALELVDKLMIALCRVRDRDLTR